MEQTAQAQNSLHQVPRAAATKAVTTAPSRKEAFPPFDSSTFASQLVWLVITFGILYWLMRRFAVPRVAEILEVRRDRVASDLAEAQRLSENSNAAVAAYEQALADARGRAQTIAGETRARLNAEADTTRRALEADLGQKLAAAERRITEMKAEALGNVRGIATEAAGSIVARLIGTTPAPAEVEGAVDTAMKG